MKGIVMNLLNEMVEQEMGLAAWNSALAEAGLTGTYTAAGRYDDNELLSLVSIISRRSGIPEPALITAFGKFMFPAFKQRYPELVDDELGLLDFLATIEDVIHVEVLKLYPDASVPTFTYVRQAENHLEMRYDSPRRLCALAEGLIAGAAAHYNAVYDLHHSPCMHDGAAYCGLNVTIR
ncbi:MAG: heme NO-binding domain-containing protein [Proteobacteria bacterium]|nr:heme NO-binding domain-containing protein [Pseudomonadota bacterium]